MDTFRILDLMFDSIIGEGGDGDAAWLSKYKPLEEILESIKQYNEVNKTGWIVNLKDNYIEWGSNQEWALITCDRTFFNTLPEWITLKIDF